MSKIENTKVNSYKKLFIENIKTNKENIKTSKMKLLAHKKQKEWAVDYNLFLFLRDAGDIGVENIRLKWVK